MSRRHPLVRRLAALDLADCFNPYADRCPVHDRPHAPRMRAALLSAVLRAAAERKVDALWVGRDLGYRGGRRTGLALTDDVHLAVHAARWGIAAARPTLGEPVAERTAKVVWSLLAGDDPARIMMWNVFPLHPHRPGEPFTNRAHTAAERMIGMDILDRLIRLVKPGRIVAIGADAAAAVTRLGPAAAVFTVRHPSYGGEADFRRGMADAG